MSKHAEEAEDRIELAKEYAIGSVQRISVYAEAQVHATLAQAEQQRIANLISLFRLHEYDTADFIARGVNFPSVALEIKNGLGL